MDAVITICLLAEMQRGFSIDLRAPGGGAEEVCGRARSDWRVILFTSAAAAAAGAAG